MVDKYLLVSEGPTDSYIVKGLADRISVVTGNLSEVILLSPQQDATSGGWLATGWTEVRKWCIAYGNGGAAGSAAASNPFARTVLRKSWQALVAISGAKGLIVQMDTDIAEKITDPPAFDPAADDRRAFCEAAILGWLGVPDLAHGPFLVLSTYAIETWLLATHDPSDPIFSDLPSDFDYEALADFEARLLALGYKSERRNGSLRLQKTKKLYLGYAVKIADNLGSVRSRCSEAEALCRLFEAS